MKRKMQPVRVFLGVIRSVFLTILFPVYFVLAFIAESRRKLGPRMAAPTDLESARDEEKWLDSLVAGHDVTWLVPLTEYFRAAALQADLKSPVKSSEHQGRFMVMNHVAFAYHLTRPIDGLPHPDPRLTALRLLPQGFVTDFASIPALLRPVVGHPMGYYNRAAIVHDWAYSSHTDDSARGRRDCDRAMLRVMAEDGTEVWRRTLIYVGLRIGGGMAYRSGPQRQRELQGFLSDAAIQTSISRARSYMFTYLAAQFEGIGLLGKGKRQELQDELMERATELARSLQQSKDTSD